MQRNVKKQARQIWKREWSPEKVEVPREGPVVEKYIEADMSRCFSWPVSVSRKKNEEAAMIRWFKSVLYQSRESRTKKGSLRIHMFLFVYILAIFDSLLTQPYRLFCNKQKEDLYFYK